MLNISTKINFIIFFYHLAYKDQDFLNSKDGYRKQMVTYKERDPEWESSLILSKGVGTLAASWLQIDFDWYHIVNCF